CRPAVDGGWSRPDNPACEPRSRGFSPFRLSTAPGGQDMARNYHAAINLHITWHTKGSAPLLEPNVEAIVHHYLRGRCINTEGVYIHEIGGMEDHVHLCVGIAPTVLISDFVGQLKGASSHEAEKPRERG